MAGPLQTTLAPAFAGSVGISMISDPYFKKLFIVCLYLGAVALAIWWSVDLSDSIIKSDIADYVEENGVEPTRDIAEELRGKSALKRAGVSALVVVISNCVFMKYILKLKRNENT